MEQNVIVSTWKQWKNELHIILLWRLILVMILYTLCRLAFWTLNHSYFPGITLSGGFRILTGGLPFDMTAVLYTNMLFILGWMLPFKFRYNKIYQSSLKVIYVLFNTLALATNCADFVYFRFTMRRTSSTVFSEFSHETNGGSMAWQFFLDYWYCLVILLVLAFLLAKLYGKVKKPEFPKGKWNNVAYYTKGVVLLLIAATLIVGGVRGGFRHSTRPITMSNAGMSVNKPLEMAIVLNTPFSLIRTLGKNNLKDPKYYKDPRQLEAIFNPFHNPIATKPAKRLNVVIIILESFNREYMGGCYASGNRKGYTPFLDSLMNHSCVFLNAYANGRKSIESMPSILASIPSLVEPFVTTQYSEDRFNSIPGLLRKKGYHTSLFHGAPNGSMGFNSFGHLAGIEHYYGMTEYGNDKDFDGMWGIWDEEFLQFYAGKLNTFPQPFASVVYTVSSHHPYKIPVRYKNKFPNGDLPIHKGIGYTDFALRRFFHKISKMPWYKNTLFVITADHANPMTEYPEFKTGAGLFEVPLIFYKPDDSLKGLHKGPAQQIDVMPTVLNYLGYNEPFISFGTDLFAAPHSSRCVNYLDGIWQLITGDYILQFDGTKTVGLYYLKSDIMMKNNLVGKVWNVQKEMESYLKAFIQQYNTRLINDRLMVKK